ncbi:MAG: hypothetical protein M0P71_00890 [Melioribacteraceae bacterium]|nr:hypothetical protein [Melioribacteraceae bacterium]
MKTQELLSVEFRYSYLDENEIRQYENKKTTIGIYETLEEAILAGNETLKSLSEILKFANKDCFTKNGGFFGHPTRLIVNNRTPGSNIDCYVKITKLTFENVNKLLDSIRIYG